MDVLRLLALGTAIVALALVLSALLCGPFIVWHARRARRRQRWVTRR